MISYRKLLAAFISIQLAGCTFGSTEQLATRHSMTTDGKGFALVYEGPVQGVHRPIVPVCGFGGVVFLEKDIRNDRWVVVKADIEQKRTDIVEIFHTTYALVAVCGKEPWQVFYADSVKKPQVKAGVRYVEVTQDMTTGKNSIVRLIGANGWLAVASVQALAPKPVTHEWVDFFDTTTRELLRVHTERMDGIREFGFVPGRESFAYIRGQRRCVIVSLANPDKRVILTVPDKGPLGYGVLEGMPYVCFVEDSELVVDNGTKSVRLPVKGAEQVLSYSGERILFLIRTREAMVSISVDNLGEVELLSAQSLPGHPTLESIERVGSSLHALTSSNDGVGSWRILLPKKD